MYQSVLNLTVVADMSKLWSELPYTAQTDFPIPRMDVVELQSNKSNHIFAIAYWFLFKLRE